MDERNSVRILDNDTLAEIAIAYDLMDTKIHEQINDKYTLDFNILPYENVWRIGYPNLLEIDNDYFQVRRVTKNRGASLDMSVSCEHVSYQMNMYNTEGIETTYTGTPYEILTHLLFGLRFTPGLVEFSSATEFKTSTVGMRSRIIEFANQIGAEVKFYKFQVSLLLRRGGDRGLTIEVGDNLLNMTEIAETQVNGEIVKSYEVGVIDLNKIVDENGQPLKNVEIHLGDTVNLIDEQFGIDINLHIVSMEYDPFSKVLPTVEIGNTIKNLFSQTDSVKINNNYWLSEFKIGDVDCLAINGVQMETSDVSSVIVEIEYESETQYTGFFLTLKEAYADSIITVTAYVDGESEEIPWNESKELFESLTLPNTGYATISEMVVTVNNGAESQYFGVKFVSESQPTATKFRNIRTEPYSTYYDEESGNYASGMAFSHKDFDSVGSGEIIGVVNRELLTGLIYVHLEGFTGGTIKFKVVIKNVGNYYGETEESIDTNIYLPSGTFTVPLHYHFYPYDSDSFTIYPELSLDGTATDVQFLEGSLWGVINYIQGVTG